MKALVGSLTFGLVLILTAGCEGWSFGGGADSWNSDQGWVDFSGRYKPNSSTGWLVSDYTSLGGTNSTVTQTLFVTDGRNPPTYTGTIDAERIVPTTISGFGSDGSIFNTPAPGGGSSIVTVTGGLGGTINLANGSFSLSVPAVSSGVSYYIVYSANGSGNPGGSVNINSFVVTQAGNTIRLVDNDGYTYEGNLGAYTTVGTVQPQDTTNGIAGSGGQTVTCQFQARGVSGAGMNVEMTGNFMAQMMKSIQVITAANTNIFLVTDTWNRYIRGTWVEEGGRTGSIDGQGDPINTQYLSSQNNSGGG